MEIKQLLDVQDSTILESICLFLDGSKVGIIGGDREHLLVLSKDITGLDSFAITPENIGHIPGITHLNIGSLIKMLPIKYVVQKLSNIVLFTDFISEPDFVKLVESNLRYLNEGTTVVVYGKIELGIRNQYSRVLEKITEKATYSVMTNGSVSLFVGVIVK